MDTMMALGLLLLAGMLLVGLLALGGVVAGIVGLSKRASWGLPVLIVSLIVGLGLVAASVSMVVISMAGDQVRDEFRVATERLGSEDVEVSTRPADEPVGGPVLKGMTDFREGEDGVRRMPATRTGSRTTRPRRARSGVRE